MAARLLDVACRLVRDFSGKCASRFERFGTNDVGRRSDLRNRANEGCQGLENRRSCDEAGAAPTSDRMHNRREGALKTQRIKSSFSRDAKNRRNCSVQFARGPRDELIKPSHGEFHSAGIATPGVPPLWQQWNSDPSGLARHRIDGAPGFIWWPKRSLLKFHVHTAAAQSDVNSLRCGSKIHLHAVLVFISNRVISEVPYQRRRQWR
jgi:hypothetical protein